MSFQQACMKSAGHNCSRIGVHLATSKAFSRRALGSTFSESWRRDMKVNLVLMLVVSGTLIRVSNQFSNGNSLTTITSASATSVVANQ